MIKCRTKLHWYLLQHIGSKIILLCITSRNCTLLFFILFAYNHSNKGVPHLNPLLEPIASCKIQTLYRLSVCRYICYSHYYSWHIRDSSRLECNVSGSCYSLYYFCSDISNIWPNAVPYPILRYKYGVPSPHLAHIFN